VSDQPAQLAVSAPPLCIHVTVHIHQADPAAITGPILAALAANKGDLMDDFHAELDADLDTIVSSISTVDADLARELADFAQSIAPKLSPDEQTRLASVAQRLADFDSRINAADPAPTTPTTPATEPAAGDGTGAGDPTSSTAAGTVAE